MRTEGRCTYLGVPVIMTILNPIILVESGDRLADWCGRIVCETEVEMLEARVRTLQRGLDDVAWRTAIIKKDQPGQ